MCCQKYHLLYFLYGVIFCKSDWDFLSIADVNNYAIWYDYLILLLAVCEIRGMSIREGTGMHEDPFSFHCVPPFPSTCTLPLPCCGVARQDSALLRSILRGIVMNSSLVNKNIVFLKSKNNTIISMWIYLLLVWNSYRKMKNFMWQFYVWAGNETSFDEPDE